MDLISLHEAIGPGAVAAGALIVAAIAFALDRRPAWRRAAVWAGFFGLLIAFSGRWTGGGSDLLVGDAGPASEFIALVESVGLAVCFVFLVLRSPRVGGDGFVFAALAGLSLGLRAPTLIGALIGFQLLSIAHLCLTAQRGADLRRSLVVPATAFWLAIFGIQTVCVAIFIAKGGTFGLTEIVAAAGAANSPSDTVVSVLWIAAITGQLIWFSALYLSSLNRRSKSSFQIVLGGLIIPGAGLVAARLLDVGRDGGIGTTLFVWLGVLALLVWGLHVLRLMAKTPTMQMLAGTSAITGLLLIILFAVCNRPHAPQAVILAGINLSISMAVLGCLLWREEGQKRIGEAGKPRSWAMLAVLICGLAGLSVAGAPPFAGFWARWIFAADVLADGMFEAGLIVGVFALALSIVWMTFCAHIWRSALSNQVGDGAPGFVSGTQLALSLVLLSGLLVPAVNPALLLPKAPKVEASDSTRAPTALNETLR